MRDKLSHIKRIDTVLKYLSAISDKETLPQIQEGLKSQDVIIPENELLFILNKLYKDGNISIMNIELDEKRMLDNIMEHYESKLMPGLTGVVLTERYYTITWEGILKSKSGGYTSANRSKRVKKIIKWIVGIGKWIITIGTVIIYSIIKFVL